MSTLIPRPMSHAITAADMQMAVRDLEDAALFPEREFDGDEAEVDAEEAEPEEPAIRRERLLTLFDGLTQTLGGQR